MTIDTSPTASLAPPSITEQELPKSVREENQQALQGLPKDSVEISDEAAQLSEKLQQAKANLYSSPGTDSPSDKKRIKERIEEIKREIQEVKESNLPEKEKNQKILELQTELTLLQSLGGKRGATSRNAAKDGMGYTGQRRQHEFDVVQ